MAAGDIARYEETLELLRTRRSVRRYTDEPVEAELVEKLVEAARWAPSAGNRQSWRILAITGRDLISSLAEAVTSRVDEVRDDLRPSVARQVGGYLDSFSVFSRAPLVMAFIHRGGVDMIRAARRSGAETPGLDPEASALASAAAAIENMLIAAHALGLGACWMTGPLLAEQELAALLEVPTGWRLTALVPVGWPAESPEPPARRSVERLLRRVG